MRSIVAGALVATAIVVLAGCGGETQPDAGATPSGSAFDKAFIDAMVPHHESALEMARAAKEAGLTQPDLVQVADDILATQQEEIDRMKAWRGEWFGSSEIDPAGAEALGLTEAEMGMQHDADALHTSGDVDMDFAQLMIGHHQGAIEMAKLAQERAQHPELEELARDIVAAQEREIAVMRPHTTGMDHG